MQLFTKSNVAGREQPTMIHQLLHTIIYNVSRNLMVKNSCIRNIIIRVPRLLLTDLATDNSTLAFVQPFLRRIHSDGMRDNSFMYGKSTSNQVYCMCIGRENFI